MKLLAIDGNSIVNRAFYGIKLLTTKDGQYTNALVGFFNILSKLEQAEHPDEVAIAFDLKAPTFRHQMYDGYKAQRKGMPAELAAQMPVLKEMLSALGYRMVTCEGYEADDILGTLAQACRSRGDSCVIATGDRDSFQLVGGGVSVQYEGTKARRIDEDAIREQYGLSPAQLIDVKSLMGDTSDNIPGVAGVGEKTALSLIQKFGTLAGVYENIDDPAIKKGVREKLLRDREQAQMSRTLAEILTNAPIPTEPGAYTRGTVDGERAQTLFAQCEMFSTLQKLGLDSARAAQLDERPDTPILPAPEHYTGECFLFAHESGWCVVSEEKVFRVCTDAEITGLLSGGVSLYCFDAKPLLRRADALGAPMDAVVFDAKLAAYLLNPAAAEYTIERLAQEYGVSGAFRCDAAPEAALLEPLCRTLQNLCEEQGMTALLRDIELPLCGVLAQMENSGILVDRQGIEDFGKELRTALEQELSAIYEEVGYEFNVNSPKQLGKALFEDLGLPTRKKTKSGFSTNAETLESLRGYSPVIDHILQYRVYQKLNSTYVEGLLKVIEPDGRIRSTFNQTETRTGRISSNEPNLQNIPVRTALGSRFRRYFVAAPGCTLVDADYSQIELRVLAHISGDEAMREAFLSGADIHRATAAKMYGVAPEDVTHEMRTSAKAINFGIIYGKGSYSLSRDLSITVQEAQSFIDAYLNTYPNVRRYMEDTVAYGKEHGYVATLYGRRRALPELSAANFNIRAQGERMAMNTPIQGTAADVIKLAMVRVAHRLKKEQLRARLILQVHDELIVECPLDEAPAVKEIVREEMEHAAAFAVPLTADVHEGTTWYDAKG